MRKVTLESFMSMTASPSFLTRTEAVWTRSHPTSFIWTAVPLMNSLALMLYLKFPPASLYLETCIVRDSGLYILEILATIASISA